jgi:hypothetical protein
MLSPAKVTLTVISIFWSTTILAQTPAEIFKEVDSRKRASYEGIQDYSQTKSTMGMCVFEYFEKATTGATDGRGTVTYMRSVPVTEISERQSAGNAMSNASPEELERAASVLRQQGPAMEQGMRQEMNSAQFPAGIDQMVMNPPADKPWLSANPNDMMGNYATMLEGAAQGKREAAKQAAGAEQEAQSDPLAAVAENTRIVGRETVHNREAIALVAEDLDYTQVSDGQTFTMNTLHIWIDAEKYVPLRMQIDGVASDGGESRPMRIEREDMSYQTVPGCGSMYEPMRSVMRISGVMSPQEQAQMAEAQTQMAQLESQLASMPPAQKEMIMRQMGPQMEMFRNMAAGKGMEVVSMVTQMQCNTGLPDPVELSRTMTQGLTGGPCQLPGHSAANASAGSPAAGASIAGPAAPASSSTEGASSDLTRIVQQQLAALGYDPGNTDGELTKQTAIAITKFQAANGMEITGKPTPQLAGILGAAVDAKN